MSICQWLKQNLTNRSLIVFRNMFSFSLHNYRKELSFLHISASNLLDSISLVCPCSPQTLSPFSPSPLHPFLPLTLSLSQWWLSSQSRRRKKQCPDLLCVVWLVIFISSHFLGPNSSISVSFSFLFLRLHIFFLSSFGFSLLFLAAVLVYSLYCISFHKIRWVGSACVRRSLCV